MNRPRNRASIRAAVAVALLAGATTGCQNAKPTPDDWFEGGVARPASVETLQLTARILAAKGKSAQAGFILERMARDHPDAVATYSEGAEALLDEGRIADAILWLDRGLGRIKGNPILLNNRGLCHLLAHDLDAACEDFQAAYAADPGDADYVGNLALGLALKGREAEAATLWGRVLDADGTKANLELARNARTRFR